MYRRFLEPRSDIQPPTSRNGDRNLHFDGGKRALHHFRVHSGHFGREVGQRQEALFDFMNLDANVTAIPVIQERADARLDGAVLVVMRVRHRWTLAKLKTHQGRGCRRNDLIVQLRRRTFDQPGNIGGTSRRLASNRRLDRQRPFIDEQPKPHDLCNEQHRNDKKRNLRAKPQPHQASNSTSQFRQ